MFLCILNKYFYYGIRLTFVKWQRITAHQFKTCPKSDFREYFGCTQSVLSMCGKWGLFVILCIYVITSFTGVHGWQYLASMSNGSMFVRVCFLIIIWICFELYVH